MGIVYLLKNTDKARASGYQSGVRYRKGQIKEKDLSLFLAQDTVTGREVRMTKAPSTKGKEVNDA